MNIFFTKKEIVENNVSFEVFEMKYPNIQSLASLVLLLMWLYFVQKQQLEFAFVIFILLFSMNLFLIIEINFFNMLKKKQAGKKVITKKSLLGLGIAEIRVEK